LYVFRALASQSKLIVSVFSAPGDISSVTTKSKTWQVDSKTLKIFYSFFVSEANITPVNCDSECSGDNPIRMAII